MLTPSQFRNTLCLVHISGTRHISDKVPLSHLGLMAGVEEIWYVVWVSFLVMYENQV